MVIYYVDREPNGKPVGEARSVIGVLDLVEGAGPGRYRVHELVSPYAGIPKYHEATARALHDGGYVVYYTDAGFLIGRPTLDRSPTR